MARTGIYKSEVKKARDALLVQGRRPSVDAVRIELGNTGSKTTIHRYLQELEEEEGASFGKQVAVSVALQDLVGRLAARLHEEAETRIKEMEARCTAQLEARDRTIAEQRTEVSNLSARLQQMEAALCEEERQHGETRQKLTQANTAGERLDQQVADLSERLKDNEAHRASLEEKHRHAREALEHYRQSVKDQRDQEQRRHEGQVQQLQVEIRTLNQTVIVKQNELTQAYQDVARSAAELAAAKKDIRRAELETERVVKSCDQAQRRGAELESTVATLTERLEQNEVKYTAAASALTEHRALLRAQDLDLAELRARIAGQDDIIALLRPSQPAAAAPSA